MVGEEGDGGHGWNRANVVDTRVAGGQEVVVDVFVGLMDTDLHAECIKRVTSCG